MNVLNSIKGKLILFTLSISLVPITIITAVYFINARSALKNQILLELTAIAESKKIHILSFMEAKRGRTLDFSSDGFISDRLERIIQRGAQSDAVFDLNNHLKVNKKPIDPQIREITIIGLDGIVVSSTNKGIIGNDISGHELFVKTINNKFGEIYVGQAYSSPYPNENCIFISTPLTSKRDGKGETIGVIINAYAISSLNEITANYTGMGESGEVVIGQRKGNDIFFLNSLRFSPKAAHELTVCIEDPAAEPMELALSGNSGLIMAPDYRNVMVLAAYQFIPEFGWGVVAKMDKAEAFAPLRSLGIVALIVGGICSVVTVFIGIVFSLSAIKPITDLKDATEKFGKGDLDYRLKTIGGDEIGLLAGSFNSMAEEIKTLTGSLEKRIAERTWKLSRTNEELRKLSRAVEQSPVAVLITDVKGDIEYVNPKFTQSTGYTQEEAVGQNTRILKSGNQAPEVYKDLWDRINSGEEWHGEFHNKKKNGELFWVTASISPIKNAEGVITHFIGVQEETTERKTAEEMLKVKSSYLRLLQVTAVAANEATELNDAFQRILNEICDHSAWSIGHVYLISKDDPGLLEPTTVWSLEDSRSFSGFCNVSEMIRFAKGIGLPGRVLDSGKPLWIADVTRDANFPRIEIARDSCIKSAIAFPVMVGARVVAVLEFFAVEEVGPDQYFIDVMVDVGMQLGRVVERKWAEQELEELNLSLEQRIAERTAELAKSNEELYKMQKLESVGVLAGGIAHDFNNSLQAILGYISLAKQHANPDDEIYEYLEESGKAVQQSKALTQQLLTFSKGGEPVKRTVALSELIVNAAKLALSGSNVRYEFGIPDDIWQIEADKGQLNQVISNLIINANQAMPEGGNIKILVENINVVAKDSLPLQEGRYVRTTIEDHGTGISEKHILKIFDPYFTTKQEGSGLGLASTYSIVKKHGGYITVESELGVGTAFHIYLPASRKEIRRKSSLEETKRACPVPVEEEEKEKLIVSKGKVLIMDDEHVIRVILSKQLMALGYEVETAEDGSEAIRLYKNTSGKPFDVVIMDLTVAGGMGGKETMKRLLEIDPDVRAIVASGYANDPVMANCKGYGFKGVLAKPHEIHELDEALQRVIM